METVVIHGQVLKESLHVKLAVTDKGLLNQHVHSLELFMMLPWCVFQKSATYTLLET